MLRTVTLLLRTDTFLGMAPVPGPREGLNAAVAAQIRAEAAAANLTDKALAEKADVNYASLRRWLGKDKENVRAIDVSVLAALADALDMTAAEIVSRAQGRVRATEATSGSDALVARYLAQADDDPATAASLLAHDGAKGANVDVFTWTAALEELHRLEQEEQDRAARNEDREPPKMGDE